MTTKSDFSPSEWKQLISAPHHIYSVLSGVDRESLLMKRKEAKALDKFMDRYGSGTGLVKEMIADERNADDARETVADAYKELESIGDLIERKASGADGDSVRTFLMKAAKEVAEAVTEERGLFKKGDDISDKEKRAINSIEKSLKASSSDARRRRSSGATASTGAAGGAAAAARQKAEVAARAAKRRAAKTSGSSSSNDATAAARQKAEVAARAAKRKASSQDADAQKAAVAARAAERKAKKDAEAAAEKAQAAAEARESSRRAAAVRQAEREQQAKVEAAKTASQSRMAKAAAAKAAAAVRTYTVVSGDTLSGISLKMYGSANKWRGIFEANGDQLKDPSLIYPGQVLKIPDQD